MFGYMGLQKMRTINVTLTNVLTTITLLPVSTSITIGNGIQLNATGRDQFGLPMSAIILYSSRNSSIATVNTTTGLVTAVALGQTNITAFNGTINKTIMITVEAVAPVIESI